MAGEALGEPCDLLFAGLAGVLRQADGDGQAVLAGRGDDGVGDFRGAGADADDVGDDETAVLGDGEFKTDCPVWVPTFGWQSGREVPGADFAVKFWWMIDGGDSRGGEQRVGVGVGVLLK